MLVEPVLVLPRDRCRLIVLRAILDGLAGEGYEHFGLFPTHPLNPRRRNQHFLARPPIPSCYLDIADGPGFVIYDKPFQMADVAI